MSWCFKLTIGWLSDQMHNKIWPRKISYSCSIKLWRVQFYFIFLIWDFLDFKTQILTQIEFYFFSSFFWAHNNAYLQISLQERTCPSMQIVIVACYVVGVNVKCSMISEKTTFKILNEGWNIFSLWINISVLLWMVGFVI